MRQLPHSIRKYLRKEKARLRREGLDSQIAEVKIRELAAKVSEEYNRRKGQNKNQD